MKKIFLLMTTFILLLAGCSDHVSDESNGTKNTGATYLSVSVRSGAEGSARTALPSLSLDSISSFEFTLKGTKNAKEGGTEESLGTYDSLAALQAATIPVAAGTWDFTLTAQKDGTSFSGTLTEQTITAGKNSLSITLYWDEDALGGSGSLSFTLDWSEAANASGVKSVTGTLLSYNTENGDENALSDYAETALALDSNSVTYALSDVGAGVYMIKIALYGNKEKSALINTWREIAVITGGKESTATRKMTSLNEVFTITYNYNDGEITSGTAALIYTTNSDEITLPTLAKKGFFWGGWYDNAEFTGSAVTKIEANSTGNREFWAKFHNPTKIISPKDDGGLSSVTDAVNADESIATLTENADGTYTITAQKAGTTTVTATGEDQYGDIITVTYDVTVDEDGTITVETPVVNTKVVNLKTGNDINTVLASVVAKNTATAFVKSDTASAEIKGYLDLAEKYIPVWASGDEDTVEILYYVPVGVTVQLNEDSSGMFEYLTELTEIDMSGWNTSKVTDMSGMFSGCAALTSLDVSNFNTANVENMSSMFDGCKVLSTLTVSSFNTEKVTNMSRMFRNCAALTTLDVSNFSTANVKNMRQMFSGCNALTSLGVSNFNTTNVSNMDGMFQDCKLLTSLDLSNFNTESVEDMKNMFNGCSALTSLDVSSFDTKNVTDMDSMFKDCKSLTSLDLNNFDTANVKYMPNMFSGCSGLTSLDVSKFNTAEVTNMLDIFKGCSALTELDLRSFDTAKVTTMQSMFYQCSALTKIYASTYFVTTTLQNHHCDTDMFTDCANLVGGNGTKYDSSIIDKTYARIDGVPTGDTKGYFTGARYALTVPDSIENGSVTASPSVTVTAGALVTLTATASNGYELTALTVTDASGNAVATTIVTDGTTYTFTMPESAVTVAAEFEEKIAEVEGLSSVRGTTVSGAVEGSSVFIEGRTVTIPTMYVCEHEVTQKEYETYCKYVKNKPESTYGLGDDIPVYYVTWYDAIVYCNLRSIAEGFTPAYALNGQTDPKKWTGIQSESGKYCGPYGKNDTWNTMSFDTTANGYRLPTEAEWEYIARGGISGTQTTYSGSDTIDDVAWYKGNSSSTAHEVMKKAPNAFDIYDMSGNVAEWCWDWSTGITASTPNTGGAAAKTGATRVYKGGSAYATENYVKLNYRTSYSPQDCSYDIGFRVVRNVK